MHADIDMPGPSRVGPPSSYALLLSGTHVTGKETLAASLAKGLDCRWIKAEMAHNAATFGSRAQAKRGLEYGRVFGRIWSSKMQRLRFLANRNELDPGNRPRAEGLEGEVVELRGGEGEGPIGGRPPCAAVISLYHMRKPARDAIRGVLLAHSIRPVFVILHISKETLFGRTLGAEEPRLAETIMAHKVADIQEPLEEERDVILVDSLQDVDALFPEIMGKVARQVQAGE